MVVHVFGRTPIMFTKPRAQKGAVQISTVQKKQVAIFNPLKMDGRAYGNHKNFPLALKMWLKMNFAWYYALWIILNFNYIFEMQKLTNYLIGELCTMLYFVYAHVFQDSFKAHVLLMFVQKSLA